MGKKLKNMTDTNLLLTITIVVFFQYPERQRSSDHTFLRYELSHDHWWNRYLRRWRGSTGQYELCGIPGLWRRQCIHFYADRRCYRPCLRYRTGLPGSLPEA